MFPQSITLVMRIRSNCSAHGRGFGVLLDRSQGTTGTYTARQDADQTRIGRHCLQPHTNTRPKASPAQTAMNPTITLTTILSSPTSTWPS